MVFRMNMRGCGPGQGLAKGIYHSGRSEDTRAVLEWIATNFPNSPITQIGISLGGNATLKMAGEYGSNRPTFLQGVAAVGAPVDLAACSQRISAPQNRLFDLYFSRHLMRHVHRQSARFPDKVLELPEELLRGRQSLARFDDLYVAPTSGFKSGKHYYEVCSSFPLLDAIHCPALLLAAEDDPIVPVETYYRIPKRRGMDVIVTKRGGHTAYISNRRERHYGRFWMDRVVVDWVLGLT
jgi:predicted alpha/beta-fold hydrolase